MSTLYGALARHGWRKLAPDAAHSKGDAQVRDEDWKKTPRPAGADSSFASDTKTPASHVSSEQDQAWHIAIFMQYTKPDPITRDPITLGVAGSLSEPAPIQPMVSCPTALTTVALAARQACPAHR